MADAKVQRKQGHINRHKAKKVGPKRKPPKANLEQAKKAATNSRKGTQRGKSYRVRYTTRFRRPHTHRKAPDNTNKIRAVNKDNSLTDHQVIQVPLTTEDALKRIQERNTLVFLVDVRANKNQIRDAISHLYDARSEKINTLIRPDGKKKAYVRLPANVDAMDVANKIGIL